MSKKSVIKKSSEIRTILEKGRHVSHPLFRMAYLPGTTPQSRWAVLTGKRFGRAVQRNRIKRQMREILRNVAPGLNSRVDLLIIPKKKVEGRSAFKLLYEKVQNCFRQEGLL